MQNNFLLLQKRAQRRQIDIGQRIDQQILARNADLKQAKFFPITMQTVRFRIDRHAIDRIDLRKQLFQLRRVRDHRSPLKSSSALVLVASRFSINFSIASIGGSAAIVFRKT